MSRERELLLDLRSKLAYEKTGSHSYSFSDDELESLLKSRPKTLDELGKIKGFPREGKRVEKFGSNIVDIFVRQVDSFIVTNINNNLRVRTKLRMSTAFSK